MAGLPVMLDVAGARCVVVGGGPVAARRAAALAAAGASVEVVAPVIEAVLDSLAGVAVHRRAFVAADAAGAVLVVIATDDAAANGAAHRAAVVAGALVNRADDAGAEAEAGDARAGDGGRVQFMAVHRDGPVTLAVHTGRVSAAAAGAIRDELASALDPAWATLLAEAAPYRERLRAATPAGAARQAALRALAGDEARRTLERSGPRGLRVFYDALLASAKAPPDADPAP